MKTSESNPIYDKVGWLPLLACALCLMWYPIHWYFYFEILTPEDGVVEYLTSIFAFAAGFLTIKLALTSMKHPAAAASYIKCLFLFAVGCIFFAGEEISWGQRLFGIETESVSPWLAETNRQGELNLHNLKVVSHVRLLADLFCLIWGAVIPLYYRSKPFPYTWLRPFIVPRWLVSGFLTTILITWPQKFSELFFGKMFWVDAFRLGEFKEFCFAIVCLLFAVHLHTASKQSDKPSP